MQTSVYVRAQTTSGSGKSYYKYERIEEGRGKRTGSFYPTFLHPRYPRGQTALAQARG